MSPSIGTIRTTRTLLLVAMALLAPLAAPAAARACANADASASALGTDGTQRAVRCLLNKERSHRGARKLKERSTLEAAAQYHATEMAMLGYFSHDAPSGEDGFDRARRFGYGGGMVGEVIAEGSALTPRGAVGSWMSSGPHRELILTRRLRHVGVGVVSASSGFALYSVSFGDR